MFTISYSITASTETKELPSLLNLLRPMLRLGPSANSPEDEIVVQLDEDNTSKELESLLRQDFSDLKVITFPLNNHFGDFKNNLKNNCSKDYIFQIDADEIPHQKLIENLPTILETYPDTGLFHVPRINTVKGITAKHLHKWGWVINEEDWINWPDWQPRIFKNLPTIRWNLPVHETIINYGNAIFFPELEEYSLYHPKSIKKQEDQNQFYSSL